jgi:hypothetical protein
VRKLIASLFAVALLAATSLVVLIPGASARDGGNSCTNLQQTSNGHQSWDTNGYYAQQYQSQLWWCVF